MSTNVGMIPSYLNKNTEAIKALQTRLAHEPEPVAYWPLAPKTGYYNIDGKRVWLEAEAPFPETAPPKKEWVGLTDKDMFDCLVQTDYAAVRLPLGLKMFAEAIEAKSKEKNHG